MIGSMQISAVVRQASYLSKEETIQNYFPQLLPFKFCSVHNTHQTAGTPTAYIARPQLYITGN